MTDHSKEKSPDFTLRKLKAQLRKLPDVQPPETLEQRLLQTIPQTKHKVAPKPQLKWYPGFRDFGKTAAAAVLIFALIFMANYGLSTPSQTWGAQLKDTSLCYTPWDLNEFFYDQNNTIFVDTNYTNFNGTR